LTPEQWRRVQEVVDAALDVPSEAREAVIDRACAGDPVLHAAAARLIRSCDDAEGFMEEPAADYAAPLIPGAILEDPPPDFPSALAATGTLVGPYRILQEAGHGGMGTVYLAERADDEYRKKVALKLVRAGLALDVHVVRRFRDERQILASLDHPGIARLLDGGVTAGGLPWFAMEYVAGMPLDRYCDEHRLTVEERLTLFSRVCETVAFAHRNLVVHRDLKPSNVLVTADGVVKLLDFGIAKLLHSQPEGDTVTQVGLRAMTPEYAAPEQVRGEPVTTATDVYALGAVLYELLTGRRAHRLDRRTAAEVERVVCETDPEPPSVAVARTVEVGHADGSRETITPERVSEARGTDAERLRRRLRGDLDTIVLKALHKNPARRYASADALLEELGRYRAGLPVQARPDSQLYRAGKFVRRHRLGVAAGAAVFLSLVGGLAGTLWQARAASRAAAAASREAAKAREVTQFVVGLFSVSNPEQSRGREITARELLERGTRRVDSALGRQPEVRAELLGVLGEIHRELGLYVPAESLARRTVALTTELHGAESPATAGRLTTLGSILEARGEYTRAESVLTAALAISRRVGDDTLTAATLADLASVQAERGNYDRAETLAREGLALDRRIHGDDHLQVASDLDKLGVTLWRAEKLPAADSAIRAALDIRRRRLDPDHPLVDIAEHNLASVLTSQGRHADAERMERVVLARRRRLHPQGHPDVATAMHQLAFYLTRQGRLEAAESLVVDAIAIRRQWLGPDHPETMTLVNNLAVLNFRMGDFRGAELALREVLGSWRRTLGPEHRNTLTALNSLGGALRDQGKYAEAEQVLRRNVESRRRTLGGTHVETGQSLLHLGTLLRRLGDARAAEAERVLRESLAIYRKAVRPGDERVAPPLRQLGAVLTARGRAAEGEPLLREALSVQLAGSAPDEISLAITKRMLGVCLAALGQSTEAERLLLESYRTFEASRYGALERAETASALAAFYAARGREAEAARYR
jgi:serine/threonine-protein kinase